MKSSAQQYKLFSTELTLTALLQLLSDCRGGAWRVRAICMGMLSLIGHGLHRSISPDMKQHFVSVAITKQDNTNPEYAVVKMMT